MLNHLYTKIKLDYIEFDAKINFLGWVGGVGGLVVLDFLKVRPTQSNLVKFGLELSLAIQNIVDISFRSNAQGQCSHSARTNYSFLILELMQNIYRAYSKH